MIATLEILRDYSFKEITLRTSNLFLKEVITGFAKKNQIKLSIQTNILCRLREPFEKIANKNKFFAFKHNKFWACMDTTRDLEFLKYYWSKNKKF